MNVTTETETSSKTNSSFKGMHKDKILTFEELAGLRARYPEKKIVQCHGVYDVLHAGHLAYFQSAKKFGHILVVTLTTDRYVNKGPGRPYFTDRVRASMVAALEVIDFVALSDHPTAVPSIEQLKPHFYIKGPDYRDKSKDVTGGIIAEEAAVERHGGKLEFTQDETHSSSTLLNRFFINWTEDQQETIRRVRDLGGEPKIDEVLAKVARQKILVVGEPIVDTYRFCIPENISSKSPSISARFLYEENYPGGALAIANHLADFGEEVHLLITHGGEPYFLELLKEKIDERVTVHSVPVKNIPTPRKTRYISVDKSQRIFEITDVRADQWASNSPLEFSRKMLKVAQGKDLVVMADFGHGLFESDVLTSASDINSFIALNVQTNSSNYGFNTFQKHKRFNYLSLDTREARIAYHDRYSAPIDLGRLARNDSANFDAAVAMTLGPNGSYFFSGGKNGSEYFSPAFTDSVVDATGAGDAFFCLTSCLLKAGADCDLIPFLGNVFAGLKTKIIGNKTAVSRAALQKAVSAILK
jgi:rfaE bifunctional protein nucleotidyltransferase chain/domain